MINIQSIFDDHKKWLFGKHGGVRANLTGADLTGANLTRANLTRANLTGADLTGADLTGANLTGADLIGADLTGANLTRANLTGADLTGAKGYFGFGPMPTSGRIVHCVWGDEGWTVQAGCFWGSLDELEARVKEKHNCPVYLGMIAFLRTYQPEQSAK